MWSHVCQQQVERGVIDGAKATRQSAFNAKFSVKLSILVEELDNCAPGKQAIASWLGKCLLRKRWTSNGF